MTELSRYAREAKSFWTARRPREAATMSDQDYEQIAAQVRAAIEQMETAELQRAATIPDLGQRITLANQAHQKAVELATDELIYSQESEPEVLEAETRSDDLAGLMGIDLMQLEWLENRLRLVQENPQMYSPLEQAMAEQELTSFKAEHPLYFAQHPAD